MKTKEQIESEISELKAYVADCEEIAKHEQDSADRAKAEIRTLLVLMHAFGVTQ